MTRFTLDSDDLFMDGRVTSQIRVWRVNRLYEPLLVVKDWTYVTALNPNNGDELQVFNGIIRGTQLYQLIDELKRYDVLVNREGCMFKPSTSNYSDTGTVYFRINDFFGLSKYNIYPMRRTVWNKLDMNSKNVIVDITQNDRLLAEYKQKLDEKEKELISCKKQLKDANDKLTVEQNKANAERNVANAFRAALKCLTTFLDDFHVAIRKDLNLGIILPFIRDKKHTDSLNALGGNDVTVSKISSTILQVVEEEYK